MSDRGSILISTANDIGEALVEKLGGEGYAPSVWDKEYNKLGIAEVDSAPALSVLEDSSETGTARGSILMSTANAIGAMLNKKYNTDRGFKPKEWASAASKLAPLPQKSAESSPVCSIEDGADDVPTKSLVVTIPPTLSGVSSVSETRTGRNLVDLSSLVDGYVNSNGTFNTNHSNGEMRSGFIPVKPDTTYYFSIVETTGTADAWVGIGEYTSNDGTGFIRRDSFWRFTTSATTKYVVVSAQNLAQATKIQLEIGNDPTTWEAYTPIKQYTANLGRTIYGGTADIVNGEVNPLNILLPYNADSEEITVNGIKRSYSLDNQEFTFNGTNTKTDSSWLIFSINASDFVLNGLKSGVTYRFSHNLTADFYAQFTYNKSGGGVGAMGYLRGTAGRNASVSFTLPSDFSSLKQFQIGVSNTATDVDITAHFQIEIGSSASAYSPYFDPFTFDGQEIPTKDGYNAFWSDQGNTALDYYGEPEPYTRGTASGAIANVQSARTDLPFTKVKANIAPNLTGVSEVKVFNTGAGLVTVPDVSGSITNAYFYNISTGFTLTAGVTYKITMVVNSTVTTFAVSVGVGDDSAYRYDIYNTGIINKNGVVSFEFTPEASHLTTWDKLWIRAPRYSDPSGSQQTTCTFTVTNILLYTSEPAVYTADLGEPINGGSVDFVSGEVKEYPYSDLGTRSIFRDPNRTGVFYCALPGRVSGSDVLGCNKYAVLNIAVSTSYDKYVSGVNSYGGGYIFFRDTSLAGLTDAELTEALTGTLVSFDNGNIVTRSIPGQVIVPSEGVNNLWNNAGGDTEVEYFEQE